MDFLFFCFLLDEKNRVDEDKILTDLMYKLCWNFLVCEKVESKGRTTYNEVR